MKKYEHVIEKWGDHEFSSGVTTGRDFNNFARDLWIALNVQLPAGYKIVNWSRGHYTMCGFVTDGNDNYVYWSIGDVRFCPKGWIKNILIRAARNEKDYTGGANAQAPLAEFGEHVKRLMEWHARMKEDNDDS